MFATIKNWFAPKTYPRRQVDNMALYYFPSCPHCRVVLSTVKRLNLDIELRNIHKLDEHKQALISGGGKKTVPCLRIEQPNKKVIWMYESIDIAQFLRETFG